MSIPATLRRIAAPALALVLAACDSPSGSEPQPKTQTPAEWLAQNAHPIRSLSPTDHDFSDLQPLKAAIGDARVVLLGEQSHGDGTTFLAKARLIAFLHREMGFDVLAWESGIWDVNQVWRHVQAGNDVLAAGRRGIFGIWMGSEQVLPTMDYVASTVGTARPLELAGFDNQLTGAQARDSLDLLAEQFARRIQSSAPDDPEWPAAMATLRELAATLHFNDKPSAAEQARLIRLLEQLRTDAAARPASDREALFWTQALESILSLGRMMWAAPPGQFRPVDGNRRDEQMGRNLAWLATVYYPGRRIIAWAASSHIARNVEHLRGPGGEQPYAGPGAWSLHMGDEAYRRLGTQMYAIGFTAASGFVGRHSAPPVILPEVRPGSLEAHFGSAGMTNAFLDLRAHRAGDAWVRNVYSRPFGYGDMLGDWPSVLDGMIYTREMTKSTPASR